MAKKKDDIPRLYVRKGASLKEIYAQVRREFTADDLQKYTVDEPMVPMKKVLAQMEAIEKAGTSKRKRKRK